VEPEFGHISGMNNLRVLNSPPPVIFAFKRLAVNV
jgi:hypothetical protein